MPGGGLVTPDYLRQERAVSPSTGMSMANIDRQVAEEIAAVHGLTVTKLGLRFDKVVTRLLGRLRACVENANQGEKTVLVTITAPIRLPGKTQQELEAILRESLECKSPVRERRMTVFQNEVQLRILESASKPYPKFVGMVHNPGTDSALLLDLATKWLTKGENRDAL
jgi:hypothetical protein